MRYPLALFVRSAIIASVAAVLVAALEVGSARPAQAATKCYMATSANAHMLCWLDLSGYSGAVNTPFALAITLPDGSSLTGTIDNTGTVAVGSPVAVPVYGTGTFGGVALGDEDYLGILGDPAIYPASGVGSPITFSVGVSDSLGRALASNTIAVADAESTDTGDGSATTAYLKWVTTGTDWLDLQLMANPAGSIANVCTLSALTNQTVTCVPNTGGAPAAAYILTTSVTSAQTITMSSETKSKQGFAYAIDLASLTTAKTVGSRVAAGDEFTVEVTHGANGAATPTATGAPILSASTTGTGTAASTGGQFVVPGDTYVLNELASAGSPLAQYDSTVTCANATAGSTTNLPAAGSSAQAVAIVPAPEDAITCTFTNYGMLLTDTANTPAVTVAAGSKRTDSFTLKNTSAVAGTFTVVQPTIVTNTGTVLTPAATTAAYVLNGAATGTCSVAAPCTLATLNATIAAAAKTAVGGTIVVGVIYTAPSTPGTVTATVPATIANGTGTSAQATASEVDTIPGLAIAKTGTTAASPGGLIAYSLTVTNPSGVAENGAVVTDALPAGVTFKNASCVAGTGSACAAPTTAVAGGVTTLSDTITTLPVGGSVTITIYTAAGAAGSVSNQAKVTPPAGTAGGAQSSAVVTTTIAQPSGITKTVKNLTHAAFNTGTYTNTANAGDPGDTLQYTLSFTNNTGVPIGNLVFTDNLPATVTYVSTSCANTGTTLPCAAKPATGAPNTYTFTGTLAVGASVSITIDVKIN